MKHTPEDPRTPPSKPSKNFAIYTIVAVALAYIVVRLFLYIQSGE